MIDRNTFLHDDKEFARTDRVHLTLIEEKDRELYIESLEVTPALLKLGVGKEEFDKLWDDCAFGSMITFMIWDNQTGDYVGYCMYKAIDTDEIDLGIELQEQYQKMGLGQEICECLISLFFERTDMDGIYYRVYKINEPSIHLVEKLGGVLVRENSLVEAISDLHLDNPEAFDAFSTLIYRINRESWGERKC